MHTLNTHGYPAEWPQPTDRITSTVSRITHAQKKALYERTVTTRSLAKLLGVAESHLSYLFPGKVPARKRVKSSLSTVRKEFRIVCAKRVLASEISVTEAASIARISYRSMARAVQILRQERKTP
jgi:hypothetical protein